MTKNEISGTMRISRAIENMIEESFKFLIFVTPYLKITERIKAKLIDTFNNVDNCYFIYRKDELKKNEKEWIEAFNNVHLIGVDNLHAKIYLNDKLCIITSMNFYEYSQINNYEIGVLIDIYREKDSLQKILEEILLITRLSEKYDLIYKTLEPYIDYSVGKLFKKIQEISRNYEKENYYDKPYVRFCNDARNIMSFSDRELYEDKSAILRSANIGKARFEKIFSKLK